MAPATVALLTFNSSLGCRHGLIVGDAMTCQRSRHQHNAAPTPPAGAAAGAAGTRLLVLLLTLLLDHSLHCCLHNVEAGHKVDLQAPGSTCIAAAADQRIAALRMPSFSSDQGNQARHKGSLQLPMSILRRSSDAAPQDLSPAQSARQRIQRS